MLCDSLADMMIFMPAPGDRTDRAILATLQRDGRIANIDLAEAVSLSPSACLRRVKALEASGIIEGYRAEISRTSAGLGLPLGWVYAAIPIGSALIILPMLRTILVALRSLWPKRS